MENKWIHKSRAIVVLFGFLIIVCMLTQASSKFFDFMKPIQFPLATMGWFWTGIVSAYFGSDRLEKIVSSREIPYGQVFKGDLGKLKFIIKMCLIMFIASVVLQYFTGDDYCMESFFSALGSSCTCYVAGNKLIDTQGNRNGSHEVDDTGDDNLIMD